MKCLALSCIVLMGGGVTFLRAGTVVTITDGLETTGALTLTSNTIQVEAGSSPSAINLPDVLEADFGETPFALDIVVPGKGSQLPAAWKAQDIGAVKAPGTVTVTDGGFLLSGGGGGVAAKDRNSDSIFFVGQPWMGDGQWTVRVDGIDARNPATIAGLMLRDTLNADSMMIDLSSTMQGNSRLSFRDKAGRPSAGLTSPTDAPAWLRLTRYGGTFFASFSSDGADWNVVGQQSFGPMLNPWIGLFVGSLTDKAAGQATFSQVSLTPLPSFAQVLPPGVLLQDGTFLAGYFDRLTLDSLSPEVDGRFLRNAKVEPIPSSKIASVLLLPVKRSQIADMNSRVGVLMKNGDIVDGMINSITRQQVQVSSVVLGITTYNQSEVAGCFLQPMQPQPGAYEIRLKDGSIINAAGITTNAQNVIIQTVDGVSITATQDEIAQIRAGNALVQNLAELDWHAASPPEASVTNVAPAGQMAPAADASPAANATTGNPSPTAQSWEGKNGEQIIEISSGTTLDFPMSGKVSALGVKIAVSAASRPDASVAIRVLADGKEIARTPLFKAGDQPRFVSVNLHSPKIVSLEADSIYSGTKVLFIDPVAIRDKAP